MGNLLLMLLIFVLKTKYGSSTHPAPGNYSIYGNYSILHCPQSQSNNSSSCPPACSWSGPTNLSCSSNHSEHCSDGGLHVEYNMTTCQCVLRIDLDHVPEGWWQCQLEDGKDDVNTEDQGHLDHDHENISMLQH